MAASDAQDDMKIDLARASELAANLAQTLQQIKAASPARQIPVRLVAVSKLKPPSDILSLVSPPSSASLSTLTSSPTSDLPYFHFGENYVQELQHKASLLPRSIKWHFIGGLQTNKCKSLAESIPNLWAVESVDSEKKVDALEKGRRACVEKWKGKRSKNKGTEQRNGEAHASEDSLNPEEEPLRIYIQLNTSSEPSKSGVEPCPSPSHSSESPPSDFPSLSLAKHVESQCPHLHIQGLMTIGAIARSEAASQGELNDDFECLKRERETLCKAMGWEQERLELSMGMSADFEEAIRQGSDEVRVGTGIFGKRPPRKGAEGGG